MVCKNHAEEIIVVNMRGVNAPLKPGQNFKFKASITLGPNYIKKF